MTFPPAYGPATRVQCSPTPDAPASRGDWFPKVLPDPTPDFVEDEFMEPRPGVTSELVAGPIDPDPSS